MTLSPISECDGHCVALERRIERLERLFALPVYPLRHEDGRLRRQHYPKFWHDLPVREAVIECHRQSTIAEAAAHLIARFGKDRAPSESALHRCWMRLDLARDMRGQESE